MNDIGKALGDLTAAVRSLQERDGDRQSYPQQSQTCLESLRRVQVALQGPAAYLASVRASAFNQTALVFALDRSIIALLCRESPCPVTAKQLADEAGISEDVVQRVMRVLISVHGVAQYNRADTYVATELTHQLNSDGQRTAFAFHQELHTQVAARFTDFLRSEDSSSWAGSSNDSVTPLRYTFGEEIWQTLAKDVRKRQVFDAYFAQSRQLNTKWHEIYPVAEILLRQPQTDLDRKVIVDIGGGAGQDVLSFVSAHRDCLPSSTPCCILQDLPQVLDRVNAERLPCQIAKRPYDFFQGPQPERGALLYYMHDICHDYSDEDCRTILKHTAAAMSPDSRLLVHDWVIRDENPQQQACSTDWTMCMFLQGGRERTLAQWQEVLGSAGYDICRVWDALGDEQSVIEARLSKDLL